MLIHTNSDIVSEQNQNGQATFHCQVEQYHQSQSVFSIGEIDKSFADQPRAINIAPKDPHLYYNRGRDCHRTEQFDDAICNFTHAINLNPQFAPAYSHRGTTYEAKGEIDKVCIDFDKADQIQNK